MVEQEQQSQGWDFFFFFASTVIQEHCMRISINENLSGTLNFFGKTEFNMIFWAEGNQGNGKGLKFVLVCESLGWPNVHHSRSNTNLVEVPEKRCNLKAL